MHVRPSCVCDTLTVLGPNSDAMLVASRPPGQLDARRDAYTLPPLPSRLRQRLCHVCFHFARGFFFSRATMCLHSLPTTSTDNNGNNGSQAAAAAAAGCAPLSHAGYLANGVPSQRGGTHAQQRAARGATRH